MLILASQSEIRKTLLENAGVELEVARALVDEALIKDALLAENTSPRDIADALADAKAQKISRKFPAALVIGADQVLDHSGQLISKSENKDQLRETLIQLRGQKHKLYSAAVIYYQNAPIWRHIGEAQIMMRDFSDAYLEDYLGKNFDRVKFSVGGYQIEGAGAGLIADIRGDYFSILGLPLFPLLNFLRMRGELPE